ncbi:methylation-associated defense system protein MAD4 [Micromonospora marina]|uniref:methylation-associated defense system protein MAD4 n=1 Tax=Micromonospora marina TaxID=307120 RepID=UPI003D70CCB6
MKRDVVFLVADAAMDQMLRGFLGRPQCHRSIGCNPFRFDAREDLIVAPFRDPDVYGRAAELLQPYERSHRHAVAMLDLAWEGSPTPEQIREHIGAKLKAAWSHSAVIVIEPELEAWVWQENPHVAEALKCGTDFRDVLRRSGHWPDGASKPPDPKAALEFLRRYHRADRSNAAFGRLAQKISVRHCEDRAFCQLRDTLREWFKEAS